MRDYCFRFAAVVCFVLELSASSSADKLKRTATDYVLEGIALRDRGRTAESLASFERALELAPKFLPALAGAAEAAYELKKAPAADYLKRLLALDPRNATAHAMAGVLAFEARDCASASVHFENAGPALRGNGDALTQYGSCLVSLQRPLDAARVFQTMLDDQPSSEVARYNLGLSLSLAGRNVDAIATLRPLANNADALNLIASVYAADRQVEPAIAALRRAIELAPTDERNYADLASLCMDHQASALALEVLDAGLKNIPSSARLHTVRGAMLAELGRLDDAQAEFDYATRLRPDEVYGALGIGVLEGETDRLDDAIALLRRRLKQAPSDYRLNYLLAASLMRRGGDIGPAAISEARSAALRSIAANQTFSKSHDVLGKIYLKTGESGKAVDEFRTAIRLDPADRVALNQLLLALRRFGRVEEARQVAEELRAAVEKDRALETANNRVKLSAAPPGDVH